MKNLRRPRRTRKSLRRSAFTLLEVMLVLVILAAIAGIAVVNLGGFQDRAFEKLAKTDISALKQSLEAYRLEVGQYPTQLNDLHEQPSDLADPTKWMQVRKDPIDPDPWGNEYEYENNGSDFVITSAGPNGKIGDDDDISNKS
ncbi:MAG: type II secretion system major pseudopilin GspG [Planctomycetota bacterium]